MVISNIKLSWFTCQMLEIVLFRTFIKCCTVIRYFRVVYYIATKCGKRWLIDVTWVLLLGPMGSKERQDRHSLRFHLLFSSLIVVLENPLNYLLFQLKYFSFASFQVFKFSRQNCILKYFSYFSAHCERYHWN